MPAGSKPPSSKRPPISSTTTGGRAGWGPIYWRGERGLGEYVGDQYDKTARFFELIDAREGFECLARPESNILCFRYGRDSARQIELRERLLAAGRFHLSSTEVDGERWLRMAVMAPATDEATIEELLDEIESLDG